MATNSKRGTTRRKNTPVKRTTAKRGKSKTPTKNAPAFSLRDEILLWSVLAMSIIILISNFGIGGVVGGAISSFFFGIFGFLTFILPLTLLFIIGFVVANKGNKRAWIKLGAIVSLWFFLCSLMELLTSGYDTTKTFRSFYEVSSKYKTGGGFIGGLIVKPLGMAVGVAGAYVILIILAIICIVVITERSLLADMKKGSDHVYESARNDVAIRKQKAEIRREKRSLEKQKNIEMEMSRLSREKAALAKPRRDNRVSGVSMNTLLKGINPEETNNEAFTIQRSEPIDIFEEVTDNFDTPVGEEQGLNTQTNEKQGTDVQVNKEQSMDTAEAVEKKVRNPKSSVKEQAENVQEVAKEIEQGLPITKPKHMIPPLSLLNRPQRGRNSDSDIELREIANKLQQTLHDFGVEVTVTNVSCGPSVTRYELTPQQGVKVSRIVNLADDIKLNLAAADIRIEAPIPGKAAVGIEVPNKNNSAVMFRELLESKEFKEASSNLVFAAGKDIGGRVVVADIAKMPHLLIAGATGSGKSVCINTIIMSILYKANPDDVRLIMIDPKVVELSVYNRIPHLLIPVVTDPKKAAGALNWAVAEMTERYNKFAEYHVRDLHGYNAKVAEITDIEEENKPVKLPQIVIIVDELADLMMVAPGEVEDAICRLAQLARAAGIHLIIATQRPSVNVITGLIKANMPSRIAFAVSSGVDSRTIIDMNGAEKLLGKGDMLFYPQGYQKPDRVQGAFVSDSEVGAVVKFLTEKNTTDSYSEQIAEEIAEHIAQPTSIGMAGDTGGNELDVIFKDAGRFIIEKEKASIGMLQRMFKIGFNRAARIMDQLSDAGVVGPEEGTKPRKVLMSIEEFEQYIEETS